MSKHNRQAWTGPQVWDRDTLGPDSNWTIQLSDDDLKDIQTAVKTSISTDKPIGELQQDDFTFQQFGERLLAIKEELLNGRGFTLIRGLPKNWNDEILVRAYWGMGQWIGDPVSQNAKAHLLGHVIDQRLTDKAGTRIYQTNRAQAFHSDSCDLVGLLCLRTAKTGGASSVASSAAIHNHLLHTHPDVLEQLYGKFNCDRYGEIPDGKLPYYSVHVFNNIDNELICCGMDPDIRSAQRLDELGDLTNEQLNALDCFQTTAKKLCVNMNLQRGDVQLVNNLIAVHAREAFTDHRQPDQRRYLIRLWLSADVGRRLPDFLSERWGNIEVGSIRGGIHVPGATPMVHLDPNQ